MSNRLFAATWAAVYSLGAVWALAAAGCGGAPTARQCMNTSGTGDIVNAAALMRVEVYAAGVACDGTRAAAGSAPLMSRSFAAGEKISLDIPPGRHTVVITAFGDAAATMELGGACADDTFLAGQAVCLNLTLSPAPDMAVPDAAMPDMAVACQDVNCPFNQHCDRATDTCVVGCKSSTECAQLAVPDGGVPLGSVLCNPNNNQCVECVLQGDCATGKLCSPSGACVDGCDLAVGKGCAVGLTCCNKLCLDTRIDVFNCGLCGMACTGGNTLCCNGACSNPNTDATNCGGCGRLCAATSVMGSPTCGGGVCNSACVAGRANCSQPAFPAADDGCETDIVGDRMNCGSCGRACSATAVSGTPVCTTGLCTSTCNAGFGNCTQPVAPAADNGCESNLNTSTTHCGACGRGCSGTGVMALSCSAGLCNSSCTGSNRNCGQPIAPLTDDGCEVDINTNKDHCGQCARPCSTTAVSGTATCSAGLCNSACNAGFGNCTQPAAPTADNGCESNLNTNKDHCGQCARACSTTGVSGTATCLAGVCNSACTAGLGNCSQPAAPAADNGCETNTNTSTTHCGACGRGCASTNVNTLSCSGGICNSTCSSGFSNCSQPVQPTADNGCEIATGSGDPNNCGSCGRVCASTNVATLACNANVCNSSCNSGFINCTQPTTPTADNGCECETDPVAPTCCPGPACQVKHSTGHMAGQGARQTFFDCVALATYNATQATKACNAFGGGTLICNSYNCGTGGTNTICADRPAGDTTSACACFVYGGSLIGRTFFDTTCTLCPQSGDPTWN